MQMVTARQDTPERGLYEMGVGVFPQVTSTGGKKMASGCARGDLDQVSEKISSGKDLSNIGTGCPGNVESLEVYKNHLVWCLHSQLLMDWNCNGYKEKLFKSDKEPTKFDLIASNLLNETECQSRKYSFLLLETQY